MSAPVLDLAHVAFAHRRDDIMVFGSWVANDAGGRDPALVLLPAYTKISHERVTPCIIPLGMAWRWSPQHGDPAHAAQSSVVFAEALGLDPSNRMTLMRITSIIHDHLDDLVRIRPEPSYVKRAVADITHRDPETGRTVYSEVMDYAG